MSITEHDASQAGVNLHNEHNLDVADGLEALARFLRQHPELPDVSIIAYVQNLRLTAEEKARIRQDLTVLAAALGERAKETLRGRTVRISGQFSDEVELHGDASVDDLAGERPIPAYVPILPVIDREDFLQGYGEPSGEEAF